MSVRKPHILLAVLALALTWGLPAKAETAAAPLCIADASPAAELIEACFREFCPEVGIRCTNTGKRGGGNGSCCTNSCVCDPTCTEVGTPSNACHLTLPSCFSAAATASPSSASDPEVCGVCPCGVPACRANRQCDDYCGGVPGFGKCDHGCCTCIG